jgi:Leucine-rich repeat (LRR) protein
MLFGTHHGSFAKTFGDLFEKAGSLRTIYLSGASYIVEDVLHNFSKLVHLRYLRIKSYILEDKCLLSALSRLYHLEVIDLQEWSRCAGSARYISNLIKLRHFLVPDHQIQLHTNIVEVGKLKFLMELRRFEVGRKESTGFELSQLGQLSELGGSLGICNLERINTTEEAAESKMVHKKHLHKLTLEWDVKRPNKDPTHEENVLEIMKPHRNLHDLSIRGHGGTKCPKWLDGNPSVKNLESLYLDGVSWEKFPPLGGLWLVNEQGVERSGCIPHNSFQNLRRLEFNNLPRFRRWVESDPCHLFSHLEALIIRDCSELTELSFSHSICCQGQKEAKMNWFPKLQELEIEDCPKLLSFPRVPWTSALCSASIKRVGSGFVKLICGENYRSGYKLKIEGNDAVDSTFWNLLAFDNLTELKELEMDRCPPLPLQDHFQMLTCLMTLKLWNSSASAKELTHLLTHFPKLSELEVVQCDKITGLGVMGKQGTATPAQIEQHDQQQDGTRGEEEIVSEAEGLLLLPSQLQNLEIVFCPELILRSDPVDDNREAAGRTWGGLGLQGLTSLRSLAIFGCPRFLSSYSSSSTYCFPFPGCLEYLTLGDVEGMETLLPLSNLTSLSDLSIWHCGDLRGEGFKNVAQGRLTQLTVHTTPNFFADFEPSPPHEQELPPSSPKLQELHTDDVAGVLVAPICALLSSSLTVLHFFGNKEVERFTKEQEEALQLLTSLESITFWECHKLQCLPAGLHRLPNLKRLLHIDGCEAIRSLPKDGLPNSLQELGIYNCPAIRSIPKECLPNSLQKLEIRSCPAIRSLPKVNGLPSSLLQLDASYGNSEELRNQCRKLIGTIPIVRA